MGALAHGLDHLIDLYTGPAKLVLLSTNSTLVVLLSATSSNSIVYTVTRSPALQAVLGSIIAQTSVVDHCPVDARTGPVVYKF